MTKNIKEKTTKAFKVNLDNRENQNILKSSAHPSNNQAHQVNEAVEEIDEVAEKICELIKNAQYSNDDIVLNHSEIKEAFFITHSNRSQKTLECFYRIRMRIKMRL
ncbi:hypothetical protein ID0992_13580 [Helicobacter pylori]